MTTHNPSIGDLVRRLRTAAAFSQEELAERAGLSVRAISDLERGGHRAPRLETVRMLADALQLGARDHAALLAAARPEVAISPSPLSERAPPRTALPLPLTRLIGREQEVAALSGLLAQGEHRLVTLTGPGGVGKTRLAQGVAADVLDRDPDGVSFVDLSPLTDPTLVMPTIASALGVREIAGESLRETLSRSLRDRRLLLVLDNCEQVLGAASDIAAVLASAPHLVILATSREPLHIRAEREIAVAPLPLPEPGRLPLPDDLGRVAAVALFVERARAANASFALTVENAPAVAAICQRLDGLPLAIELAAARVKVLTPEQLQRHLEHPLDLLSTTMHDVSVRQRTMRAAIAWSYDLLAPYEQKLFRRLSVFAGGLTLEAAEAVGGTRDADVLVGLAGLIDQSLVRPLDGATSRLRYAMLETVREFALEELDARGEGEAARMAHATYFLNLAEQAAAANFGSQESAWLDWLEAERSNLRAAQNWLEHTAKAELALRLAAACFRFWRVRGPVAEGRATMERALTLPGRSPADIRVLVTLFAGELAYVQGNDAADRENLPKALALARQLDDPAVLALALNANARVLFEDGHEAEAETLWEQAVSLARSLEERSIAFRMVGSQLEHLGFVARCRGDLARAAVLTEEALAWAERIDFEWSAAMILGSLAAVVRDQGDLQRAARLYRESLRRVWAQRDRRNFASALFGFALTVAESGQPEPAARLCGAAQALLEAEAAALPFLGRPDQRRVVELLQAILGEERFTAMHAVGQGLSAEYVLALAEEIEI
jgi:predicted ATPase/DNA-binding XRE family transcriptional regulator